MSNYEGKNVFCYIRVSTDKQAKSGDSVEDQTEALHKWCNDNGCFILDTYIDAGFSGAKEYTTRPAFCKMLDDAKTMHPDLLVFTRLDRFTRNPRDYYNVVYTFQKNGLQWKSIWQDFDSTTASGQAMIGTMMVFAKLERDTTSERIKLHNKEKRERHELTSGKMPRGYINVNKKPVIDPDAKEGVQAFWNAYLAGSGLKVAMEEAEKHGVKFSGVSSASFMLRNAQAYTGMIQNVPTEPYLTQEQADLILSMRKAPIRKTGFTYMFKGLVYCADCGKRFGSHKRHYTHIDGSQGTQVFYNCTRHFACRDCGNNVSMGENKIESYLLDTIETYVGNLVADCDIEEEKPADIDYGKEIEKLKEKKVRAYQGYIDGMVSHDMFISQASVIDKQIAELEEKNKVKKPIIKDVSAVLPENWNDIYDELTVEYKRQFWYTIIEKIVISKDREIDVILRAE